ncbi:hypothetical protein BBD42_02030 [Paenibacillus sp. BIHB 4019]|uniref:Cell envelope-related transcriptional attenuator domain-containing protein n=1 Tax=Paenibacillus sp. BIHB 4019 TaxID=1870819 RepID=A0A1B2DCE8_9BACL|nr:LCP family protein [Paenibacillus sp. BIHB 4019]ANY65383.1 hypothetical protein BBD42_02030 [Paenibacillus sp. BIHB 4019]
MKRWVKRSLIIVSTVCLVAGLGTALYSWYLYGKFKKTAADMFEPIISTPYVSSDSELQISGIEEAITAEKPFTVLVMGVDERTNDRGRTDTMIVMGVNPLKHSIFMFNIPRDTRTAIIGHGTTDKINHAYAFGGVEMSKQTVEHFLDYPIDYYIRVNMEGFSKIIDELGGVTVNNPYAFDFSGYTFEQGPIQLNGEQALLYSRMRYEDPKGDRGRNDRQRAVLKQLISNVFTLYGATQISNLLAELGDNVRTNISFDEMKTFFKEYGTGIEKVDSIEISGSGTMIDKVWYYIVGDQERNRIHELLKKQMSIETDAV